jgi:predicted Zn-dependent protease with MMP-like domain
MAGQGDVTAKKIRYGSDMERGRFRALVAQVMDDLPEPFLSHLRNVEVVVEEEPAPGLLRDLGLHPKHDALFGLYEGTPIDERAESGVLELPDKITIFYGPLIREFRGEKRLRREIRKTVIHEVGHFFGLEDDELEDEGY